MATMATTMMIATLKELLTGEGVTTDMATYGLLPIHLDCSLHLMRTLLTDVCSV